MRKEFVEILISDHRFKKKEGVLEGTGKNYYGCYILERILERTRGMN